MRKVKGIPLWEQYIEFMVLGAVTVTVGALLLMQFLGSGNVVNDIRPQQMYDHMASEAQRIERQLTPDARPPVDPPTFERAFPAFASLLKDGIGVEPTLPRIGPDLTIATGGERIGPGAMYAVPTIPPASVAAALQYYDGLEEVVFDEHPELRERWTHAPYDATWVTVAAVVDKSEILRRFREGGNGVVAPPSTWYRDRATIVDVRVEREQYIDGQWGERTVLEPLLGQISLRQEIAGEVDAGRRDAILSMLQEPGGEAQVAQPAFYPTRNDVMQWPDPRDPGDNVHDIPRLIRHLQQLRAQRDAAQRELDDLRGARRPEDDRRPPTPDRSPAPGRRGPPGPGGPGPGPGPSPTPTPAPSERGPRVPDERQAEIRIRDLDRSIGQLNREIHRIEGNLREAGVDVENLDRPAQIDEELVWAHDITVEPGNTYRYRIIYDVYNPFFARRLHLTEEQHHLADQFVLSSQEAEWSEPIHVKPTVHMYIARAFPPGDRSISGAATVFGSATVEVFRFYDGRWWSHSFTIEPGQRIGGEREVGRRGETRRIDFTADWFVLDVIPDPTSETGRDREGRAARVVLQHIRNGTNREIRHPLQDMEDSFRQRLVEHSQLARLE